MLCDRYGFVNGAFEVFCCMDDDDRTVAVLDHKGYRSDGMWRVYLDRCLPCDWLEIIGCYDTSEPELAETDSRLAKSGNAEQPARNLVSS